MVLKMNAASCYLPKVKSKSPKEGEDAHFIFDDKNTIGVADGVGGWAKSGVDSGIYARLLMNNSLIALQDEAKGAVNPAKVLEKAYENTNVLGSSTVCIIALNGKVLDYVNVGDSGMMVFRDKKMIYRSPIQQHRFNTPYQLGKKRDRPSLAYQEKLIMKEGDIVVAGTDGLFDNMYPWEIMVMLEQECDKEPEELASMIAVHALFHGLDRKYFSPYAEAVKKSRVKHKGGKYGVKHKGVKIDAAKNPGVKHRGKHRVKHRKGGKYDDITVVVAKIENIA